jgi:hypothetical protein
MMSASGKVLDNELILSTSSTSRPQTMEMVKVLEAVKTRQALIACRNQRTVERAARTSGRKDPMVAP